MNVFAGFGGNARRVQRGNSDYVLNFVGNPFGVGGGQVDFVDYGNNFEVVVNRKVGVRQGLCLNPLGSVHDEHCALTGGKRTGNLVVEVHVSGGVDEVKDVFPAVVGVIVKAHGAGFDGYAALPLNVHIVEELFLHVARRDGVGVLQNSVRKGGFAVVDVRDYTKVSDIVLWQVKIPPVQNIPPYILSPRRVNYNYFILFN